MGVPQCVWTFFPHLFFPFHSFQILDNYHSVHHKSNFILFFAHILKTYWVLLEFHAPIICVHSKNPLAIQNGVHNLTVPLASTHGDTPKYLLFIGVCKFCIEKHRGLLFSMCVSLQEFWNFWIDIHYLDCWVFYLYWCPLFCLSGPRFQGIHSCLYVPHIWFAYILCPLSKDILHNNLPQP